MRTESQMKKSQDNICAREIELYVEELLLRHNILLCLASSSAIQKKGGSTFGIGQMTQLDIDMMSMGRDGDFYYIRAHRLTM